MLRQVETADGGRQDIFQAVIWGDPQTPLVGQENFLNFTPPGEARPKISDVVELAVLRTELEEELFGNNTPPINEWLNRYMEVVRRHPNIRPYGHLFNVAFYQASHDHELVKWAWEEAHGDTDGTSMKKPSATADAATKLFKKVFDMDPQDPVKVGHNQTMLGFTLSDRDYAAVVEKQGKTEDTDPTDEQLKLTSGYIPHVIFQRSDVTKAKRMQSAADAVERYKSFLFFRALRNSDARLLPPWVVKNLNKVGQDPYAALRDRLLGHLATLSYASEDSLSKQISDIVGNLNAVMLKTGFTDDQKPSADQSDEEMGKITTDSNRAFVDVYNFFAESNIGKNSARLTLNVLNQFALTDWPAVARRLKAEGAENQIPTQE